MADLEQIAAPVWVCTYPNLAPVPPLVASLIHTPLWSFTLSAVTSFLLSYISSLLKGH